VRNGRYVLNAEDFKSCCLQRTDRSFTARTGSFYKNVDNFHSLYASYQLFSKDGECVLENVFCSEGKKSILSALVQQKQVAKITRDLKRYFKNGTEGDA
jgi:hypothetical protein